MKRNILTNADRASLYLPVLVWMGVIFYLSSVPGSGGFYEMPTTLFLERKGAHVFEFFVLTLLLSRAFLIRLPKSGVRALWLSASFALAYAASDEAHQLFVPNRTGKATDVLIDGIGIVIAIASIAYILKRRQK